MGMTTCEGLVCLADGRITAGDQVSVARKASLHGPADRQVCIMTSGLRSLRDKTIAYFEQEFCGETTTVTAMHEVLALYAQGLRRAGEEDGDALKASALSFDLHAIIAGQMADDQSPTMFLVYPEGNWIELSERASLIGGLVARDRPPDTG